MPRKPFNTTNRQVSPHESGSFRPLHDHSGPNLAIRVAAIVVMWANFTGCPDIHDMIQPNGQIDLLQRLMNTAEARHRVLSQNLANVNTPGYHRVDVSFEAELERQLRSPGEAPQVVEQAGLTERKDGNNVDMDHELGQLSQNSLIHQTCTQLLVSQMSQLRRAMS